MVISYDHISNHIVMLCNYVLNLNSDPQSKFIPTFLQFVLFLLQYFIHYDLSERNIAIYCYFIAIYQVLYSTYMYAKGISGFCLC